MKKLVLAVLSLCCISYGFAAGDPGKAAPVKKENVRVKKSCDDICEEIKTKSQQISDFKDQAHEKGMEAKEKSKLQKKIANLRKDVSELKQDLHKKKCPKCEIEGQTKQVTPDKEKE